jgi:hypothetical protein
MEDAIGLFHRAILQSGTPVARGGSGGTQGVGALRPTCP